MNRGGKLRGWSSGRRGEREISACGNSRFIISGGSISISISIRNLKIRDERESGVRESGVRERGLSSSVNTVVFSVFSGHYHMPVVLHSIVSSSWE